VGEVDADRYSEVQVVVPFRGDVPPSTREESVARVAAKVSAEKP
jgi:hypothetical protein